MKELLATIDSKIDELKSAEQPTAELEVFKKLFEKNPGVSITDIVELDPVYILSATILANVKGYPPEMLETLFESARPFLESMDMDKSEDFCKYLDVLENSDKMSAKAIKIGKNEREVKTLTGDELFSYVMNAMRDKYSLSTVTILTMKMLNGETDEFLIMLTLVSALNEIRSIIAKEKSKIDEYAEKVHGKVHKKRVSKYISELIGDAYNVDKITESINDLKKYYEKLQQQAKNDARRNKAAITVYENVSRQIREKSPTGEITDIDSWIVKIPDESLRLAVLKYVYEHNAVEFKKVKQEYDELLENATTSYQALLKENGILPEMYDVEKIMKNSLNDVRKILEILKKLGVTDSKHIISILQTSSYETVEEIYQIHDQELIDLDIILKHIALFDKNSDDYKNFKENYQLISNLGINPYIFRASQEVFFAQQELLKENISTMNNYDLAKCMKTGLDLSFMGKENLTAGIDMLLELGYEKYLEEDVTLLNYISRFKRLYLLKNINVPITTKEELTKVLQSDEFFIPDNELDDYIYNAATHRRETKKRKVPAMKLSDYEFLKEYSATGRTYEFNGVVISKNRVHRNLANIQNGTTLSTRIIDAIVHDAILSDVEYMTIKSEIKGKIKEKIKQ